MTDLKPCPFCGKPGDMDHNEDGYQALCSGADCFGIVDWCYETEAEAVEKWNHRPGEAALAARVDWLEENR